MIKTLRSIEDANVVILVLDAQQDISDQDAHIAGFVLESGRALVVAVNKVGRPGKLRREQGRRIAGAQARSSDFDFALPLYLRNPGRGWTRSSVRLTVPMPRPWPSCRPPSSAPCSMRSFVRRRRDTWAFRPKMRYAHQGRHESAADRDPWQCAQNMFSTAIAAIWNIPSAKCSNCREPFAHQFNTADNPMPRKQGRAEDRQAGVEELSSGPPDGRRGRSGALSESLAFATISDNLRFSITIQAWVSTMSNKGQFYKTRFNTFAANTFPVSIYLVNGIKLRGQIESFDQYVVLLKNTVTQMVYKARDLHRCAGASGQYPAGKRRRVIRRRFRCAPAGALRC